MNGQKERLMVLDMIAEGKITAEEAEELFKAMDATEEPASDSPELVSPLSHLSQLSSLSNPSSLNSRASSKDLIAALKEAKIDQVTLSDVQELQTHKLTAEYVREMLALGPDVMGGIRAAAVGHRVVHGGTEFAGPVLVEPDVIVRVIQAVQSRNPERIAYVMHRGRKFAFDLPKQGDDRLRRIAGGQ